VKFLTDPTTDIGHSTDGWADVDLTSLLGADAGNVRGAYIQIHNNSAGALAWGVRKNGGSSTLTGDLAAGYMTYAAVEVDANDIFELYLETASSFNAYLIGYWVAGEVEWLGTETYDITPGSSDAWVSSDLSSYFSGTVQAAIIQQSNAGSIEAFGAQILDGSDRRGDIPASGMEGTIVLASSETIEVYQGEILSSYTYLLGAVIGTCTAFSGGEVTHDFLVNNAWEDEDLSAAGEAGSGATGILCQHHDGSGGDAGGQTMGTRVNGASYDLKGLHRHGKYFLAAVGSDRISEQLTGAQASVNGYYSAYMSEYSAGGDPEGALIGGKLVGGGLLMKGVLVP
jgi:hypothetical protein